MNSRSSSPEWVDKAVVLAIHDAQLTEHGGANGIRDEGALDSALARPQHLHAYEQPDLYRLAAAYAFGLARNHPFVDGNKRTSELVTATFLELNGFSWSPEQADIIVTWLAIADGSMREDEIVDWLRGVCHPSDDA